MKRLLILAAAILAATASLTRSRASRATDDPLHGTVASLTADRDLDLRARRHRHDVPARRRSPSVANVAVGDRVRAVCVKRRTASSILAKLRKEQRRRARRSKDTKPVTFGGAITALTDASICLHDGDRDLTCTLGPDSPATGDFKVGQHAKVACADGVLVAIAAPELGRYFVGTVCDARPTGRSRSPPSTAPPPARSRLSRRAPLAEGRRQGRHGLPCLDDGARAAEAARR